MNVTRRKFLMAGGVCALFAGLATPRLAFGQSKRKNPRFELPHESKTDPVFYFNRESFAPYVGTEFRFYQKGVRKGYALQLEGAVDLQAQLKARRVQTHGGECFSLYFRGPSSKDLPQGTYRMEHGALGVFSLFLVPGRPDSKGVVYEAVINHLA